MKTRMIIVLTAAAALLASLPARSSELTVNISGIKQPAGKICCALYGPDQKFLEPSAALDWKWVDARNGVQCRFANIGGGAYAVAVFQDYNNNRTNDTNLLGIPTEPWGVSNNARPMFRAPTFEEAQVAVDDGKTLEIGVTVETTLP